MLRRPALLRLALALLVSGCAAADDEPDVLRQEQAVPLDQIDFDLVKVQYEDPLPHSDLDNDGDGISNFYESLGCTDPNDPDSDDDGIPDGMERRVSAGFNYQTAGADPCHRDIFVEVDYEERVNPTSGQTESGRPSDILIEALTDFYAALPIANPDGTTGIKLHVYRSDVLPAGFDCDNLDSPFSYPNDTFHKLEICLQNGGYNGHGGIPGQRFRIYLAPPNNNPADDWTELRQYNYYHVFIHELGHNLSLHHGGNVDANHKPHYPSAMNYWYAASLDGSPKTIQDAGINYSTGVFASVGLDECNLREKGSFPGFTYNQISFMSYPNASFQLNPGSTWVDWNRNGVFETGTVQADINDDGRITCASNYRDVDDMAILAAKMGCGLPANPDPSGC